MDETGSSLVEVVVLVVNRSIDWAVTSNGAEETMQNGVLVQ